ncbi:MAG TPA: hypothetical protein VH681_09080 [Nitrospiraceae bacterium]|jgi:hypothetical protein
MYQEEKTFTIQFSLEAAFPDNYDGDSDNQAWTQDWESQVKPELLKSLFVSLRQHPAWKAHIRNRGKSPLDEIEIVLSRDYSQPQPFGL